MQEIKVYCAHAEVWPLEKIIANPKNPNHHPEKQIKLLAKIIQGHGWRAPITVSKRSGFVVRGHGRLAAAQLLGLESAPVDLQDYASEAEEYADMIADNRIAELAEIDEAELTALVAELDSMEYNTGLLGFTDQQIKEMLAAAEKGGVQEDDFDAEEEVAKIETPESVPGAVYRLGEHRLMCGDSTKQQDVEQLMDGELADMVLTDPPYNVAYEGGTADKLTIENDSMSPEEFYDFLFRAFCCMEKATKAGGPIYCWYADRESVNFMTAASAAGWDIKQVLVWCKNTILLTRKDYQWQHEPALYGWKPGAPHKFYGARKQSTCIPENFPMTVQKDTDGETLLNFSCGLHSITIKVPSYTVIDTSEVSSIWHIDKPSANREHPTMKPIALMAKAITNSSLKGELVLDLFGGSTLIACEETGRRCRIMELSPKYCDVIIRRWEKLTGKKATRIN